jgi:chromosome segregation ATPase
MEAMAAEVERRRGEVETQAAEMMRAIEERSAALAGADAEYARVQAVMATGGGSAADNAVVEERARALEDEKLHLEREKMALERSVRDLTESSLILRSNLDSAEAQRAAMESQLGRLNAEEGDLHKERQLRKRLERKLQIAEDSLKRLDSALRRSGVKLDVDVFADVKTLLSFFEERCVALMCISTLLRAVRERCAPCFVCCAALPPLIVVRRAARGVRASGGCV